jgi:hypothetical protein
MTQEPIIFTMTAVPRLRGEQLFLSHIDQILANGAGAAVFSIIDIANGKATLRGEMIHDPRTMTSEALEEYLEDVLASREGIELNLSVTIPAHTSRQPFSDAGATVAMSAAQEEQSPDLAVINATRERIAASPLGRGSMAEPGTRDEKQPATGSGYSLPPSDGFIAAPRDALGFPAWLGPAEGRVNTTWTPSEGLVVHVEEGEDLTLEAAEKLLSDLSNVLQQLRDNG